MTAPTRREALGLTTAGATGLRCSICQRRFVARKLFRCWSKQVGSIVPWLACPEFATQCPWPAHGGASTDGISSHDKHHTIKHMKKRHGIWALLLIGVLAIGIAGCKSLTPEESTAAGFNEVKASVKTVVEDPARAEQLLALIAEFEKDLDQHREEAKLLGAVLLALNADYNATREDMEHAYDAYEREAEAIGQTIIKAIRDMKALTTPEEWTQISATKHRLGGY